MLKSIRETLEVVIHRLAYPLLPYPSVCYVILSNGRTGSNFLVSLLSSHPQIHQYGEVIGESLLRMPGFQEKIQRAGVSRYVQNCFRKRFYRKAVGMKFLYNQLLKGYAKRWNVGQGAAVLEFLRRHPELRILHLKRRNRLKILVSFEIAKLTREYVIKDPASPRREMPVTLTPEQCQSFFKTIRENESFIESCFQPHQIKVLYYEDLASDTAAQCREILDFLELPPYELKSNIYKQSNKLLSERIQNYRELKDFFQGTESAAFFKD